MEVLKKAVRFVMKAGRWAKLKILGVLIYNPGVYWNDEGLLTALARPFEYLIGVTVARQQINRTVPRLLRQMNGDIIDIGGYDNRLKQRYRGGTVSNLDLTRGAYTDLVMDAGDMSLASESLGGVLCVSVLEHAASPESILREIHRTLKSGGLAYISTPWLFEAHMEPNDFQRFSAHWWEARLAGFEILEVDYTNSLLGCVAHFMQHNLLLRFTLGPFLAVADRIRKPQPKYSTQISYVLRKR